MVNGKVWVPQTRRVRRNADFHAVLVLVPVFALFELVVFDLRADWVELEVLDSEVVLV